MRFYEYLNSNQWTLYHGSNSEQIVGTLYANERDSGWFGSGFYLTAYPEYAKRWGQFIHNMIPPQGKYAEINCYNNYQKIEYVGDAEKANELAGGKAGWVTDEHAWSQQFTNNLKSMGYSGVRINLDNHKDVEVLVFDPSKIKVVS